MSAFREKYLDHDELTAQVKAWAESYPELVRLSSLTKTAGGRDQWLLTIGPDPDAEREAQNPLAGGHVRDHLIDEVRGPRGHASPSAGGAKSTALAAERQKPVGPAVVASESRDPVGEHAAFDEAPHLGFHEARHAGPVAVPSGRLGEERFEMLAYHLMQERALTVAPYVFTILPRDRRIHPRRAQRLPCRSMDCVISGG